MAMVKLRASCVSGIYRCMRSQSQTLSLLHTQAQTQSRPKIYYPSWHNQEELAWPPGVAVVSEDSESECAEWESLRKARGCRAMCQYSCYSRKPKLAPWTKVVKNMENIPVDERLLDEGTDFQHWRVYLKPLRGYPTRDQFVSYYLRTMSQLLHSEEEASKKIYSVATKHYFAFGANISPEQADIITEFPNVILVQPDYYEDPKVKRYLWDSFVNGQALSYDPKNYPHPAEDECLCDEELEIVGFEVPFRKHAD